MTVDTEALIAAVRAGDIEAAQALLPVDPIVRRAREICGRHFGDPGRFLRGECDDGPHMGAVSEALSTPAGTTELSPRQTLMAARAACYAASLRPTAFEHIASSAFLNGGADKAPLLLAVGEAIQAALVGNPPVVPAMSA